MYKVRIEIVLKPGHSDPEGEMTAQSLKELKFDIKKVNVSKIYTVVFEVKSKNKASEAVEQMCKKLLANPTKDNYRYELEEEK